MNSQSMSLIQANSQRALGADGVSVSASGLVATSNMASSGQNPSSQLVAGGISNKPDQLRSRAPVQASQSS